MLFSTLLLFSGCLLSTAPSSKSWGRSFLAVSGSLVMRTATRMVGAPSRTIGSGFQYTARLLTKGVPRPKILAEAEHSPTA